MSTEAIRSWNEDHLLEFRHGQVRVDWIKALLPLFQRILERAKWEDIGGRPIRVADAEGLLVLKLIAMRPQDQQDIQGILTANRGSLDLDWVRRQWWAVVDEDDPAKLQFEQIRPRVLRCLIQQDPAALRSVVLVNRRDCRAVPSIAAATRAKAGRASFGRSCREKSCRAGVRDP